MSKSGDNISKTISRKRVAHVGTGSRARFYRKAIVDKYSPYAEYVGFCDNNPGRLKLFRDTVQADTDVQVPAYDAADFDRMGEEKLYINDGSNTGQGEIERGKGYTKVIPIRGPAREVEMWSGEGGHAGPGRPVADAG